MAKQLVYYQKNVPYTVVVRRHTQDSQGFSLNEKNTSIAIDVEEIREFKIANKRAIMEGMIIPIDAPSIDWETPNALTDEDINELLKNYMKLKVSLKTLDSISTLSRLLDAARDQDKSIKVKNLIKDRMEELGVDEAILSPQEMQGAS